MGKFFARWLAFIFPLFLHTPSEASGKWSYMGETESEAEKDIYYYDNESVVKNGDNFTVWIKVDRSKNRINRRGSYSIDRYIFHCFNRKFTLVNAIDYRSDGRIINNISIPTDMRETEIVVPESIGQMMYNGICGTYESLVKKGAIKRY